MAIYQRKDVSIGELCLLLVMTLVFYAHDEKSQQMILIDLSGRTLIQIKKQCNKSCRTAPRPPILGESEPRTGFMFPQNWGLGGLICCNN
jgi:hypothetical protein